MCAGLEDNSWTQPTHGSHPGSATPSCVPLGTLPLGKAEVVVGLYDMALRELAQCWYPESANKCELTFSPCFQLEKAVSLLKIPT